MTTTKPTKANPEQSPLTGAWTAPCRVCQVWITTEDLATKDEAQRLVDEHNAAHHPESR